MLKVKSFNVKGKKGNFDFVQEMNKWLPITN